MNCFYGVVANSTGIKALNLSKSYNGTGIFRLEKITVNNSHVGVMLKNHYSLSIDLREIAITNCYSGVFVSKTMFTKVKMSELMFDTGVNAIIIRTIPGYFEQVDLCDDSYYFYNASFPVEIIHSDFSSPQRSSCSMVFATSPDNVLSGFVSEATNIILRIRDYNSSELLFDITRNNASQHFIMDWQSSAVIVEIQFQGYYYSNNRVKIFLTSRPINSKTIKLQ
ncbi:Hypothetical predicted protein [Paramuricea clavata]|uniref:Uncharacterized protein n=1 Tax=Paramuricea clavata TaxID=317549 RepID=A0A7D9IF88_PARCT|nr:Hypothetical predicted protein [Paramuricea clavata]